MRTSEQINEIAKAMGQVQGEMKPAVKSSKNPYFKSSYSDISSIWEAIRAPLRNNQIIAVQDAITSEGGISVVTRLVHASGQWMEFGPLEIPIQKRDAQAIGSAISYAKRYGLSAALGVVSAEEDDDGEAATAPTRKPVEKTVPFENPELIESKFNNFLTDYPDEDEAEIRAYIIKYASHWKKTITEALNDYRDKSKFMKDFEKWREKSHKKVGTA